VSSTRGSTLSAVRCKLLSRQRRWKRKIVTCGTCGRWTRSTARDWRSIWGGSCQLPNSSTVGGSTARSTHFSPDDIHYQMLEYVILFHTWYTSELRKFRLPVIHWNYSLTHSSLWVLFINNTITAISLKLYSASFNDSCQRQDIHRTGIASGQLPQFIRNSQFQMHLHDGLPCVGHYDGGLSQAPSKTQINRQTQRNVSRDLGQPATGTEQQGC